MDVLNFNNKYQNFFVLKKYVIFINNKNSDVYSDFQKNQVAYCYRIT